MRKPSNNNESQSSLNYDELRYMKNQDQVQILESEFAKDYHWSKEKISKLAKYLKLKESQIYKWNWDRRQIHEKYIMKRIENDDIPGNLFKVYKPKSENENGQTVVDEEEG